jgi:hypothetical protein
MIALSLVVSLALAQASEPSTQNPEVPLLEDIGAQLQRANQDRQAEQERAADDRAEVQQRFEQLDRGQRQLTETRDAIEYGTTDIAQTIEQISAMVQNAPADPAVAGPRAAAAQAEANRCLELARQAVDNENPMAARYALDAAASYLQQAQQTR